VHTQKILGIAASLRNARCGVGNRRHIDQLREKETKEELLEYLAHESELHVGNLLAAGQRENKDVSETSSKQKVRGNSGLSNSEVALAAALWAAHKEGAEIDHVSLAEYFSASGQHHNLAILRSKLLEADGLLISGPVYFGDRGSLAESLIEFIANDPELKAAMLGRLYGGIAVGAKRNGGQETSLIYQMIDMVNLGFLAVGNDSETTAQYGGTGHAGDVGTMHKDSYGIDTSMGTGRRMARVLKQLSSQAVLRDGPKVLFLVLQEADGIAARAVARLVRRFHNMQATVLNLTGRHITRCIACDVCPSRSGLDEEYRCVIASAADSFARLHRDFLDHDLIVPVGVLSQTPAVGSRYQLFLERTRYLRHADYAWSDVLVAPLILEEPGDYRTLPARMITSLIRQHTVMTKPMIGYLLNGVLINHDRIEGDFLRALDSAARLAAGRLALAKETAIMHRYNPIGYAPVVNKGNEDQRLERRRDPGEARRDRLVEEAERRLEKRSKPRVIGGPPYEDMSRRRAEDAEILK